VAQKLARHADPKLIMGIYTHLGMDDLAGAGEGLPERGWIPKAFQLR